MTTQLNIANYDILVSGIHDLLVSGQYKAVTITVFNDAEGSSVTMDSNGSPIQNRTILSTSNTSEYVDLDGNTAYGTVVLKFSDGSTFVSTEVLNSFWYSLSGISIFVR